MSWYWWFIIGILLGSFLTVISMSLAVAAKMGGAPTFREYTDDYTIAPYNLPPRSEYIK